MDGFDATLMMADETIGAAWSKDERAAATLLTADEARWLTDYYYQVQNYRIRSANQIRAGEGGEPNLCVQKMLTSVKSVERRIGQALGFYVKGSGVTGDWLNEVCGIGPVIAAGLLAHIDISKARYGTNIWSFAGLNPSASWLGKEGAAKLFAQCWPHADGNLDEQLILMCAAAHRNTDSIRNMLIDKETGEIKLTKTNLIAKFALRPWNGKLKVLCWKAGQSFVKTSGNDKSVYGPIYAARKCYELVKNENGDYADQAAAALVAKNIGKETEAYKAYIQGKLPLGHIQARAERYAVKIFLSHLHAVWRFAAGFGVPPLPYALEHVAGHHHLILPPHMDVVPGLAEAIAKTWTADKLNAPRVSRVDLRPVDDLLDVEDKE